MITWLLFHDIFIIQGKANIEVRNNREQTPLMLACTQGHYSVVELLVETGASVLATDEDGHSPLHLTLLRLQTPEASRSGATAGGGSHSAAAATSGSCSGDKNVRLLSRCYFQ